MSDEELLRVCRDGDTEAFAALWERHRRAGFVAARSLAPSLDADDLVSEAYLRIFELVRAGRGPTGAFRPYLYRVIRSVSADRFRSGEQSTVELHDVPELHETAPWEDNAFDLNAVTEAFSSLTPRWQAALWYTEVEGLPPREAAVFLGLSANSTSALAARARDALKSAWVEAHVHRELADGACRFTIEHLQRFQRGKLTARVSRQVEAHLDGCDACTRAAAEAKALNRQLGLVLAWISLGGAGAGLLASQLGLAGHLGAAAGSSAGGSAAGGSSATTAGASAGSSAGASAGASAVASVSGGIIGTIGVPAALASGAGLLAAAVVGITVVSLAFTGVKPGAGEPAPGPVETTENETHGDSTSPERGDDAGESDDEVAAYEPGLRPIAGELPQPPQPGPAPEVVLPAEPPAPAVPGPPVLPPVTPPVIPPVKPPVTPPDTGDPSIRVGYTCMIRGDAMIGEATRYGVIQLRVTEPGKAPVALMDPTFDPAREGQPGNLFSDGLFHDGRGHTFDVGFFTGTDHVPTPGWYAKDPTLLPNWPTLFPGKSLDDVTLEMRLVTPGKEISSWQPVDTSKACN